MDVQLNRRGFGMPARLRWAGVAAAVMMAAVLGASSAALARHHLDAQRAARALPDVTDVEPQPHPTVGQIVEAPGPP